ncbi:MAG: MFS transporter [Candidatus Bathyarchaeia archaeon]
MSVRTEESGFIKQVLRFAVVLASYFIGYGLVQPIMSLYTAGFVGTSYLMVGTLISTIGLVKASMDPVSGFLSDMYGRKRVASVGALTMAVGMLITTLAASSISLFVAYPLYGFGQALFFLAIMTSMVEVAGPSRRALALGIYEGVNGVSILLGTIIVSAMAKAFELRLIFGVTTVLITLSFLLCALFTRETLARRETGPVSLGLRGVRTFVSREYVTGMFCAFMFMYTHSLFTAVMPLYATETIKIPLELMPTLFMGFSGSTAIGSFTAGPISDRVGRKPPIALGMLLLGVSFAALPFMDSLPSLTVVSLSSGFAAGFFHPVASAIIADVSTEETRGKAYGFYRLVRDSGAFVGPAISGAIASLLGVSSVFGMSACLSAVGALLAIFVMRETSRMRRG